MPPEPDPQPAAAALRPLIDLERVRVEAAGRTLLRVERLSIGAGERVAVVGPNGAGKSTLLRLLNGMATAAQGSVRVLGRELGPQAGAAPTRSQWRSLRRRVGLVMQGLHLVPRLSARENVLVGALARLHGADRWRSWLRLYPAALLAEADAALAELGLAERAHTRTDRLSGGERQKVGLARLQLQGATLVLADEPTSALDPVATAQVCAALLAATAGPGRTLVTVLHDLDLLPVVATRALGMAHGRILWDLPMPAVDRDRLAALYDHRDETAAPPAAPQATAASAPGHPPLTHCSRSAA